MFKNKQITNNKTTLFVDLLLFNVYNLNIVN